MMLINNTLQNLNCTTMLYATVSYPSSGGVWRDSSFFCVWKSRRRVRKLGLAGAICRIHHLHPSSQRPNPMDTCLSWTSESTSPIPPCLHGSWAYGCLVYKPSPIFERIHSSIQVRETERERGSTYRVLFMTKSRELQQQTQRRNIDCAHVYISRTNKLWNNIHFL